LSNDDKSLSKILQIHPETTKHIEKPEFKKESMDLDQDNLSFNFLFYFLNFRKNSIIVYLTLQNEELSTRKSTDVPKNFKYNEARADNVAAKFYRFLPKIPKRRDRKKVFKIKKN